MNLQQRNLLITGGAGFIGSNFAHYWHQRYPADRLVVLDSLTYAGNSMSLTTLADQPSFTFIKGDICDASLVKRALIQYEIDTLVHFAAESHVDRSITGPDAFVTTNILGTHALLKTCREVWLDERKLDEHHFHHISTDEVYGSLGPADPAFTESTAFAPNSPYAASKAASDHLVRAYFHTYGLKSTTTNCSNNYGPYQFPEKLIPLVILNILQGRPLPIYGDGRNIRDWLHVRDHCAGIERAITRGRVGATYNIGGNCEKDNLSLVELLCNAVDQAFKVTPGLCKRFPAAPPASGDSAIRLITFVKDRPGHDRRYAVDTSLITAELGFVPAMGLEDGLADTVEWYLSNEPWWRAVISGAYREWVAENYGRR